MNDNHYPLGHLSHKVRIHLKYLSPSQPTLNAHQHPCPRSVSLANHGSYSLWISQIWACSAAPWAPKFRPWSLFDAFESPTCHLYYCNIRLSWYANITVKFLPWALHGSKTSSKWRSRFLAWPPPLLHPTLAHATVYSVLHPHWTTCCLPGTSHPFLPVNLNVSAWGALSLPLYTAIPPLIF